MNLNLVNEITKSQLKTDIPEFRSGSTVRVHVKIIEGGKSRIQVFEGVVIERTGGGIAESFTVRKYGITICARSEILIFGAGTPFEMISFNSLIRTGMLSATPFPITLVVWL